MRRNIGLLILLHAAFASLAAVADGPATPLSLPTPQSAAAAAIGAENVPVLRPSSAREFASSLAMLADGNGNVKPSVSLEASPWLFAFGARDVANYGKGIDADASREKGRTVWKRGSLGLPAFVPEWTAVNTTLSVATGLKTSGGADRADKVAVGIKVPWFDEGDPRIDLAFWNCVKGDITSPQLPTSPTGDKARIPVPETMQSKIETCRKKAQAANTFAKSAGFGFAQGWKDIGTDQEPHLVRAGYYGWFSYTAMFGDAIDAKPWGLTAQAKITRREFDPNPAEGLARDQIPRFDANAYALKVRGGSGDSNFDLSGSIERRKFTDGRSTKSRIGALGYEIRISEDLWLRLAVGAERGEKNDGTRAFVSTSINFSRASEPSLCIFGKDSEDPSRCRSSP